MFNVFLNQMLTAMSLTVNRFMGDAA